jgi:hypothetical protein
MLSPHPPFVHRRTYNGTYDSICTRCFQVVSNQLVEVELEDDELSHCCSGSVDCSTLKAVNAEMRHKLVDEFRSENHYF